MSFVPEQTIKVVNRQYISADMWEIFKGCAGSFTEKRWEKRECIHTGDVKDGLFQL